MPPITDLVEATEAAIIEGYRLGVLTELDRAAVQALRDLAVKISVQDEYFDALRHEQQDGRPPGIERVNPHVLEVLPGPRAHGQRSDSRGGEAAY